MRILKKVAQLILICVITLSLTGCNGEFKKYNSLTFKLVDVENSYIDPSDNEEYFKLNVEVTNKSKYDIGKFDILFNLYDKKDNEYGIYQESFCDRIYDSNGSYKVYILIDKNTSLESIANIEVVRYTYNLAKGSTYDGDKYADINLSEKKVLTLGID